jgi:hypothetical protein
MFLASRSCRPYGALENLKQLTPGFRPGLLIYRSYGAKFNTWSVGYLAVIDVNIK